MKTLAVTIKLELEVPDDWTLERTSEGVDVLRIGDDQYLDFTFEPMVTRDVEGTWTNGVDDEFLDDLLAMVVSEEVDYRLG